MPSGYRLRVAPLVHRDFGVVRRDREADGDGAKVRGSASGLQEAEESRCGAAATQVAVMLRLDSPNSRSTLRFLLGLLRPWVWQTNKESLDENLFAMVMLGIGVGGDAGRGGGRGGSGRPDAHGGG